MKLVKFTVLGITVVFMAGCNFFGRSSRSSPSDDKAVLNEVRNAYTACVDQLVEIGRYPSSLQECKYSQEDSSVGIKYVGQSGEGFKITGSKGSEVLTIDNHKNLYDKNMKKIYDGYDSHLRKVRTR